MKIDLLFINDILFYEDSLRKVVRKATSLRILAHKKIPILKVEINMIFTLNQFP